MHELSGEPRRDHDTAPISLLPRGWFDTQAGTGSLVRRAQAAGVSHDVTP